MMSPYLQGKIRACLLTILPNLFAMELVNLKINSLSRDLQDIRTCWSVVQPSLVVIELIEVEIKPLMFVM